MRNGLKPLLSNVYILKKRGYYKVGHSKNPIQRKSNLQTGNEATLDVVFLVKTDTPVKLENFIKEKCRILGKTQMIKSNKKLRKSEWFSLTEKQFYVIIFELKTRFDHKFNMEIISEAECIKNYN